MHLLTLGSTLAPLLSHFDLTLAVPFATLAKRTSRTSSPSGCLVVRGSGTGLSEYSTLQAAVTALGSTTTSKCIFVYSGTYNEQVRIGYGGPLTLYGYTTDASSYKGNTVNIVSAQSSSEAGLLDTSSAVNVVSANFKVYNINFKNSYGIGAQAVAFTGNGDKQGYYGCGFYSYQDTLYAKAGKQYYSNCYIEGAIDFIFGDAIAWFGECTIAAGVSNRAGTITANSREESSDTAWYVIDSSTVNHGCVWRKRDREDLPRPSMACAGPSHYQNSVLTDVVSAAGWTTLAANATPIFEEWDNSGAGSDTSAREYETKASGAVSKTTLWGSDWGSWIDESY
ncbi:probable pectinesterase precursor [Phialocephala subalpina]|uniref:Pectinesterase n=1 Tax=Phialocephala subalpina TaxID=576137 RepID=A0A1L7X9K8_9HELO|nr:probable pectinesterase precursor [Phialocephala subalpina]